MGGCEKMPDITDNWRGVLGTFVGVQCCKANSSQVNISNTIKCQVCQANGMRNNVFVIKTSTIREKIMGSGSYLKENRRCFRRYIGEWWKVRPRRGDGPLGV